jgi:hypothetical protein
VNEIIGENEKMFGYLVYSEEDNVYAGIVDANTVKLKLTQKQTSNFSAMTKSPGKLVNPNWEPY